MASAAQIEANRLNAALSCGPKTPTGRSNSSRNHLKFGLFSTLNCVRPEETAEYNKLSKALWKDLNPVGTVEQILAVEIVRAAWRLHRCTVAEAEDGGNPVTQASVDRARASAHNSLRRLLNDLRRFQSDRWLRAEVLREGFDEANIGIADAHRVIKGLADNERLKAQFLMAPIGIDPLNQTVGQASRPAGPPATPKIRTQSRPAPHPRSDREGAVPPRMSPAAPVSPVSAVGAIRTQPVGHAAPVAPAVSAAGRSQPATIRTQPVGQAPRFAGPRQRADASRISTDNQSLTPGPQSQIPRNAPCPCNSGLKYKRCCGTAAPPVLTKSALE